MCGIAGIQSSSTGLEQSNALTSTMLNTLSHRGPDHQGLWGDVHSGTVLGHRRLSIIDTSSAGHQPMSSDDGRYALSFNGEIYNYQALRHRLEGSGYRFESGSDTEVLLKGYIEWGAAVLDRLVGMFAFALWDGKLQRLFLARDRAGEKPLYFTHTPTAFAFASETQALTSCTWIDRSIDPEAIALYLQFGYIPAPLSIYRGIRKLPPAHAMIVDAGGARIWRYWDPLDSALEPPHEIGEDEAVEELEGRLKEAVRLQMIADVPLGAFLSGGIDSSTIVAMMTEVGAREVQTFTIGFDVPRYDESPDAARVAEHLGTKHTTERLSLNEALDLTAQLPRLYGEPFADPSALPTRLVSQVARKYVTVSLSGDGADELFGGYRVYGRLERYHRVSRLMKPFAGPLLPALTRVPGKVGRAAVRLREDRLRGDDLSYRYLFSSGEVEALLARPAPPYREAVRVWKAGSALPIRRRPMLTDFNTYLPGDVLTKVDRAAMSVSLETRAPFLDHRLVEWSLRLPYPLVTEKYLLRKLLYRKVPRSIVDRPKQGFDIPIAHWFRHDLRDHLQSALSEERLAILGFQSTGLVRTLIREHVAGIHNHDRRLWALFVLGLWLEARGQ